MNGANRPLPYADDLETIPADEADDLQRVIDALELILARTHAKSGQFRADVHVKTHGYAEGEFRVLPNLPEEFAQGLFEHDGRLSGSRSVLQRSQPGSARCDSGWCAEWRSRCWGCTERWCWQTSRGARHRIS